MELTLFFYKNLFYKNVQAEIDGQYLILNFRNSRQNNGPMAG